MSKAQAIATVIRGLPGYDGLSSAKKAVCETLIHAFTEVSNVEEMTDLLNFVESFCNGARAAMTYLEEDK